jgi:hypothetical protein
VGRGEGSCCPASDSFYSQTNIFLESPIFISNAERYFLKIKADGFQKSGDKAFPGGALQLTQFRFD